MAILPDLDPNEIGVIAFWNCHDHRVAGSDAVIDPTDVLGVLKSYTLYDNGVDGILDYSPRKDINVRVKNDGWIIAWIDRTNTYQQNVSDFTARGYYDLLYNWKDYGNNITGDTNTLIEVIAYLYNQLSNKSEFEFSKLDVGVYCYEFAVANVITMASTAISISSSGYSGIKEEYVKFLITSGTSVKYIASTGSGFIAHKGDADVVYRDGTSICDKNYGALDLLTKYITDSEDHIKGKAWCDGESVTTAQAKLTAGLIVIWG